MEKTKESLRSSPKVQTRLSLADRKRLENLAKAAGKTQSDYAREALIWYMDNQDKLTMDDREAEVAQAIRYATDQHIKATRQGADRICKMLARQSVAIGTVYELMYHSAVLDPDVDGEKVFNAAVNLAKSKIRKSVERDEAELAEGMKRVAGAGGQ